MGKMVFVTGNAVGHRFTMKKKDDVVTNSDDVLAPTGVEITDEVAQEVIQEDPASIVDNTDGDEEILLPTGLVLEDGKFPVFDPREPEITIDDILYPTNIE